MGALQHVELGGVVEVAQGLAHGPLDEARTARGVGVRPVEVRVPGAQRLDVGDHALGHVVAGRLVGVVGQSNTVGSATVRPTFR